MRAPECPLYVIDPKTGNASLVVPPVAGLDEAIKDVFQDNVADRTQLGQGRCSHKAHQISVLLNAARRYSLLEKGLGGKS